MTRNPEWVKMFDPTGMSEYGLEFRRLAIFTEAKSYIDASIPIANGLLDAIFHNQDDFPIFMDKIVSELPNLGGVENPENLRRLNEIDEDAYINLLDNNLNVSSILDVLYRDFTITDILQLIYILDIEILREKIQTDDIIISWQMAVKFIDKKKHLEPREIDSFIYIILRQQSPYVGKYFLENMKVWTIQMGELTILDVDILDYMCSDGCAYGLNHIYHIKSLIKVMPDKMIIKLINEYHILASSIEYLTDMCHISSITKRHIARSLHIIASQDNKKNMMKHVMKLLQKKRNESSCSFQ